MRMTDAITQQVFTPDQCAAHEFLVELRTRIATRRLPYQHGVETRALESLKELFDRARETMKKYPGCVTFSDAATRVLNLEVRPVTAKWHKASVEGRLNSRDGSDEFRIDLEKLRAKLCEFEKELRTMAYGEPSSGTQPPGEYEKDDFEQLLEKDIARCFEPMDFGIATQGLRAEENFRATIKEINEDEAEEVAKRRETHKLETTNGKDAVGLALSGGGIRSATFCLGVVQVLAERRLLKDVDVLSTVSGGGYTGSFLTSRMGDGASFDQIARPHGPDTDAIAYLRQHAKYLAAINLKQKWGMVTATIAGLLLNWTAPFFLLALLALLAVFFTDGFHFDWWHYAFAGLVGLTILAMLFYAYAMRWEQDSARWAGGLLGALAAFSLACGALWALQAGFFPF
jgi:hypothetical protein